MDAPASAGFGVIVTDCMSGAPVSRVTCLVTVVLFPAESVATIVIVFSPSDNVICVVQLPFFCTVTGVSLTFNITGLDVASLVVPDTVRFLLFVTRFSDGLVTFNVGGTVSILIDIDFCVAAFPSLSLASNLIVWLPSPNADAVCYVPL